MLAMFTTSSAWNQLRVRGQYTQTVSATGMAPARVVHDTRRPGRPVTVAGLSIASKVIPRPPRRHALPRTTSGSWLGRGCEEPEEASDRPQIAVVLPQETQDGVVRL